MVLCRLLLLQLCCLWFNLAVSTANSDFLQHFAIRDLNSNGNENWRIVGIIEGEPSDEISSSIFVKRVPIPPQFHRYGVEIIISNFFRILYERLSFVFVLCD